MRKICTGRVAPFALAAIVCFSLMFSPRAEAGHFSFSGLTVVPPIAHTVTLLPDGRVLVVGGFSESRTQLYDPATGTWSLTGSLNVARYNHTATLLANGKVLVAGGVGADPFDPYLASAEIYDPDTGLWTLTGSLNFARDLHTATLLPNGKVLVAGGEIVAGGPSVPYASAELFDPVTGTWTNTGSLNVARHSHTATLLHNGLVLVAGGKNERATPFGPSIASCELYDSTTGTWASTYGMTTKRYLHTATLLTNGQVLVAGGYFSTVSTVGIASSAEVFDAVTGSWTNVDAMYDVRSWHSAALLPNGKVLVTGGLTMTATPPFSAYTANAEVYDPATKTWAHTGSLNTARGYHQSVRLQDGRVLIVGGQGNVPVSLLNSTELYDDFDPVILTGAVIIMPDGGFQFGFTSTAGLSFSILASTNVSQTITDWSVIGVATEMSPGQFQFTDIQATNHPQRFYRARTP